MPQQMTYGKLRKVTVKDFQIYFFLREIERILVGGQPKNCLTNIRGKYTIFLGSDDLIKPDYISKCVAQLEKHLDAAFVMVHRSILDEKGIETEEAPFYDNNYKLYPPSQIGVYFMSPINPSITQVFYRSVAILKPGHMNTLNDLYFGHRFVDFKLCLDMPVIYLRDALIAHRVHGVSQSQEATENLIQIIGQYLLNFQLKEMSSSFEFDIVDEKFEKSLKKIAETSLRYSVMALANGHQTLARRYWHLALAIEPEIENSEIAHKLSQAIKTGERELIKSLKTNDADNLRTTSYTPDPPFEYI